MSTNNAEANQANQFTRTPLGKAIAVTISILYASGVFASVTPQKVHAMLLTSVSSHQLYGLGQDLEAGEADQVTTDDNPSKVKKNGGAKVLRGIGIGLLVLVSVPLAMFGGGFEAAALLSYASDQCQTLPASERPWLCHPAVEGDVTPRARPFQPPSW